MEKAIVLWYERAESIFDTVPLTDITRKEIEDDHRHVFVIEKQAVKKRDWIEK